MAQYIQSISDAYNDYKNKHRLKQLQMIGITPEYVQSFATDTYNFLNDSSKNFENFNWDNKDETYSNIKRNTQNYKQNLGLVKEYLNLAGNKESQDYIDFMAGLDKYGEGLDAILSGYTAKNDEFSKFNTKEEYETASNDYTFREKYKGKTYDEIQEIINTLNAQSRRNDKSEEIEWINKNRELFVVSSTDIEQHINYLEQKKQEIIDKQREQAKTTGWDTLKEIVKENKKKIAAIDAQIGGYEIMLKNQKKLEPFTNLVNKKDFEFISEKPYQRIKNPSIEDIEKWDNDFNAGKDVGFKAPEIQDPLRFYLENEDAEGLYPNDLGVGRYFRDILVSGRDNHWDEINESETKIYNYVLNTQGKEKALEYLKVLAPTLNKRFSQGVDDAFKKLSDEGGILTDIGLAALSVPLNVWGGAMAGVQNFVDLAKGKDINPYNNINNWRIAGSDAREQLGNRIDEWSGLDIMGTDVLEHVYNSVMSGFDSLFAAATSGGFAGATMLPSLVLGSGAAANYAEDAYNRGAENWQIALGSFAAGAAEVVFEKFSIDNLLDKESRKGFFKNMLKQAGVEATEEMATEIANNISDDLIMNEKSNFNTNVRKYMEQGLSYDEAYAKATQDSFAQILWAGVGAFISGGNMTVLTQGPTVIKNGISYAIEHRNDVKAEQRYIFGVTSKLVENIINNPDIYTNKYQIEALKSALETAKKSPTKKNNNKLLIEVNNTIIKQRYADMNKAFNEGGVNNVDSENFAKTMNSIVQGLNVSNETISKIKADENAIAVVDDFINNKESVVNKQLSEIELFRLSNVFNDSNDVNEKGILENEHETEEQSATFESGLPKTDLTKVSPEKLTSEQRKIMDFAKSLGLNVSFVESITTPNGQQVPSSFNINTGDIYINQNYDFSAYATLLKAYLTKLGHESGHKGEIAKEQYDKFYKVARPTSIYKEWLQGKTGLKNASVGKMESYYRTNTQSTRKNAGDTEGSSPEGSHYEMIADFMGDVLFAKDDAILQQIIDKMNTPDRNAFLQWVIDIINTVLSKIGVTKNIRLKSELNNLINRYTDMLKSANEAYEQQKTTDTDGNGGVKYDIGYTTENKPVAMIDTNILDGVPKNEWVKTIKNNITNKFPEGIPISGRLIKVNRITKNEITNSKYTKYLKSTDGTIYADKLKATNNLDDIVLATTNYINEDLKHIRKDNFKEFARGDVLIRVGKNDYTAKVIVGLTNSNNMVLYDIVDFTPTTIKIKENISNRYSLDSEGSDRNDMFSNTKIPQNDGGVNTYSMQDRKKYSVDDNSKNKNVNTEYVAEYKKLVEALENGEISLEEFRNATNELYNSAGEEYGTIEQGETVSGNENFTNAAPKKIGVNKHIGNTVRTILEGGDLTEDMVAVIKQQLLSGDISYIATSNENNIAAARKLVERGIGNAKATWNTIVNGDKFPAASDIALGELLLQYAIKENDAVSVVKLTAELAELGTRAGQVTQAFSLLKRMDGVAQLLYVQRSVNKLNEDLVKKYGKDAKLIEIDEIMAKELANSKTAQDFNLTYESLLQEIGSQVPATFLDKWNAWRYMSMLFNPTTHIRNIFGNAIFIPSVKLKDIIAVTLERTFRTKRTKSIVVSKEYKNYAKKYFESIENQLTGTGKMNPTSSIEAKRKIFDTKWLEGLRKYNFDLLEKEDILFLRKHFVTAFGGYLQAQRVDLSKTINETLITKAEEYAKQEALKNTYRDASKIANLLTKMKNKNSILNIGIEGVLPFKKTPINIMKRGVEYSPLGALHTLTKGLYDLKKGNITASQWIDSISANLSGSLIVGLGALLYSLGIVTLGFSGDDEDDFAKLTGKQEYSIEILGHSYTIDWMAPSCIPFFMGAALQSALESEGNENLLANAGDVFFEAINPLIELSALSGVQNTISSVKYANSDKYFSSIASSVITSYLGQALPTVLGKVGNTIDRTQRSNYIDKSSEWPEFMQVALNTIKSKIPGLSYTKPAYVDAWGETKDKGNFVGRFFQNFLSPGYYSKVETNAVSDEINRLYKSTGNNRVFPDNAPKKISFKGYTKNLNADEYTTYATIRGQNSAQYVAEAIASKEYVKLSDEAKVKVISDIYAYCNAFAKSSIVYSYDEFKKMEVSDISESKYNSLSDTAKQKLAKEYFLKTYMKPFVAERNGQSIADFYIKKYANEK